MASSDSMDDSFGARVAKAFGSLSSSSQSQSQPSSLRPLWSLTADEVEKREWNRESSNRDDDETPCSSSFDGLFAKDRQKKSRNPRAEVGRDCDGDDDEDDDADGDLGTGSSKQSFTRGGGDAEEEWEIRSSIGLDCTLDNEEEEDEFDKVAEGKENAGDRLYMRDATDHGPYLNSHSVLSSSIYDGSGSSGGDLSKPRGRLREDAPVVQEFSSFQTSGKSVPNVWEPCSKVSEDGSELKPILKRFSGATNHKSQKRVRFDPDCKYDCDREVKRPEDFLTDHSSMETQISDDSERKVPDYVLNPTKYTCYSLDSSSEVNEESNRQAYMEFLNLVKGSKPTESSGLDTEGVSAEMPKSVTFIPRKKASDEKAFNIVKKNHEDESRTSFFPVGIAAEEETHQSEVCMMDEDEPETNVPDKSAISQKPSRSYRSRAKLDDSVE